MDLEAQQKLKMCEELGAERKAKRTARSFRWPRTRWKLCSHRSAWNGRNPPGCGARNQICKSQKQHQVDSIERREAFSRLTSIPAMNGSPVSSWELAIAAFHLVTRIQCFVLRLMMSRPTLRSKIHNSSQSLRIIERIQLDAESWEEVLAMIADVGSMLVAVAAQERRVCWIA
jgi:hypothetical protein